VRGGRGPSVRDIKAPSRKFLPLQAAPGLVDGWLRPRIQQSLTVTAARFRARAGDRTAEKRLAWRKTVVERQQYAERLESHVKAIDSEVARMLHGGAPCGCCAERLEHLSEARALCLVEIAKLPSMVVTYSEFVRGVRPPLEAEDTVTPEQTLAEAGISSNRQAKYQRRMSSLLAGRT